LSISSLRNSRYGFSPRLAGIASPPLENRKERQAWVRKVSSLPALRGYLPFLLEKCLSDIGRVCFVPRSRNLFRSPILADQQVQIRERSSTRRQVLTRMRRRALHTSSDCCSGWSFLCCSICRSSDTCSQTAFKANLIGGAAGTNSGIWSEGSSTLALVARDPKSQG
jgi:hypothetical protein